MTHPIARGNSDPCVSICEIRDFSCEGAGWSWARLYVRAHERNLRIMIHQERGCTPWRTEIEGRRGYLTSADSYYKSVCAGSSRLFPISRWISSRYDSAQRNMPIIIVVLDLTTLDIPSTRDRNVLLYFCETLTRYVYTREMFPLAIYG